ncbi:MAG: hypothetical protein J0M26_00735 [Planctomycetes bacterium]|nr:hypothetical protein [Planctomycetota bacterium]
MFERKFNDLSTLSYRIFTVERKVAHTVCVTVMEWSGVFGHGSRGNDDGVFMRVTTLAALSAWHANGVVFDLRNLHYEWGDKIWKMYGRGIDTIWCRRSPLRNGDLRQMHARFQNVYVDYPTRIRYT